MTTQHTPGPWVVDYSHPDWVEGTTIWAKDEVIAHAVADVHHETEANARLIAAAPDLLVALREAVEIIEGTGLDATTQREAIAKATGEAR